MIDNRRCISLIMQTSMLTGTGLRVPERQPLLRMCAWRRLGSLNAGAAEALGSASRSCAAIKGGMPDLGVLGLVVPFATAFLILTSLTLSFY